MCSALAFRVSLNLYKSVCGFVMNSAFSVLMCSLYRICVSTDSSVQSSLIWESSHQHGNGNKPCHRSGTIFIFHLGLTASMEKKKDFGVQRRVLVNYEFETCIDYL